MNIKALAKAQMRISCNKLNIPHIEVELNDDGSDYERGRYDAELLYDIHDNFKGFMNEKIILHPSMLDSQVQVRGTVAHECRHAWQMRQDEYSIDFGDEAEEDARRWAKEQVDAAYVGAFSDVKIDEDNDVMVKMGDIWCKHFDATEQLQGVL